VIVMFLISWAEISIYTHFHPIATQRQAISIYTHLYPMVPSFDENSQLVEHRSEFNDFAVLRWRRAQFQSRDSLQALDQSAQGPEIFVSLKFLHS
jgi:hypothetical protein